MICRCCLKLDEASRVGGEKLFAEFRYLGIRIFMGAMDEFECMFFGCVDARIRDNEAVHTLQVLLNVDRPDIRLCAHLFEDFDSQKLSRSY